MPLAWDHLLGTNGQPWQCIGRSGRLQTSADAAGRLAQADRPAPVGLYVHVPFCFHKCHYCDFYSIVDDRDRQRAFADRLIDEIAAVSRAAGQPTLSTLFVGGGTPTLLAVEHWRRLLAALPDAFDLAPGFEFTVEANPETVTDELMRALHAGGVNRVSIGCQSFHPTHLKTLERWHEPANVGRAMTMARRAGIGNINLDLIFGIPGQSLDEWRADLDRAVALEPTHLSCYALTYEPNTAMTRRLELGRLERIDEEVEASMYEATIDALPAAGFEQYEVSNFARRADARCQHNLLYWQSADWLAVGPSASGHVDGLRWKNLPHLGRYLAGEGGAPVDADSVEQLDHAARVGEQLMMRLRLMDGTPTRWLTERASPEQLQTIERHIAQGLLRRTDDRIHLTRRGLMVADSVLGDLL